LWRATASVPAFIEEAQLARQQILNGSLAGDFESVAQALLQVARDDLMTRDLTLGAIRRALQALIVHFPVYRTYISARGRSAPTTLLPAGHGRRPADPERRRLAGARHLENGSAAAVAASPGGRERKILKHACVRFQQLTSPAAAKAVEDTAFYRSAVLLSRNDVGFNTEQFSAPLVTFTRSTSSACRVPGQPAGHRHPRPQTRRRHPRAPGGAQRAQPWYAEQVEHWRALAAPLRSDDQQPSAGDELILYQALLGSWPLDLRRRLRRLASNASGSGNRKPCAKPSCKAAGARRTRPMSKARSVPVTPAAQRGRSPVARRARRCRPRIAPAGALNGLAQTLLRMTVPGVPDLYQGNEFWDFSLVDPDNRRPVDYAARQQALNSPPESVSCWQLA
jgi:(1->4)-alpha-D-glucan 1-alpha-D-glucosylmutase